MSDYPEDRPGQREAARNLSEGITLEYIDKLEGEVDRLRSRIYFLLTTEPAEWEPEVVRWLIS